MQFSVQDYELAQGAVTAIVTDLGFAGVMMSGRSDCQDRTSSCVSDLMPTARDPDYKTTASL